MEQCENRFQVYMNWKKRKKESEVGEGKVPLRSVSSYRNQGKNGTEKNGQVLFLVVQKC